MNINEEARKVLMPRFCRFVARWEALYRKCNREGKWPLEVHAKWTDLGIEINGMAKLLGLRCRTKNFQSIKAALARYKTLLAKNA